MTKQPKQKEIMKNLQFKSVSVENIINLAHEGQYDLVFIEQHHDKIVVQFDKSENFVAFPVSNWGELPRLKYLHERGLNYLYQGWGNE